MEKNFNKDIMEWQKFPQYDLIWTDPPWETRMLKFFETMMRKHVGHAPANDLTAIFDKLGSLADPLKPLIIEYSVQGHHKVIEIMEKHGHRLAVKNRMIQSMDREFVILAFNFSDHKFIAGKGFKIITNTLSQIGKSGIVFDPFAGIGNTCKAVKAAGWEYIGSELNPERFKRLQAINQ
jgi:hypothetical protein